MKKYLVTIILAVSALGLQAQNRKQVAQFSLFRQYYNPAMTGLEGSQLKGLYRDQWTGFTDAPRTLLLSGEVQATDLASQRLGTAPTSKLGASGAWGFTLLRDTFGPFQETQFNLGYGSQVRLSEALSLRAGAALDYQVSRLDVTKITVDDEDDPDYQDLLGADNNQTHKLDVNAGLTLVGENFYLGYAIQDLAKGRMITGDDYYNGIYPWHHVLQGGYRREVTEEIGLVVNGLYRYDSKLKETLEGQVKGVWNNTVWAGMGYRKDQALNLQAGVRLNQFRLGYAREMASGRARNINSSSNELVLTYQLGALAKAARDLAIW